MKIIFLLFVLQNPILQISHTQSSIDFLSKVEDISTWEQIICINYKPFEDSVWIVGEWFPYNNDIYGIPQEIIELQFRVNKQGIMQERTKKISFQFKPKYDSKEFLDSILLLKNKIDL
jgi:hypothetical protein